MNYQVGQVGQVLASEDKQDHAFGVNNAGKNELTETRPRFDAEQAVCQGEVQRGGNEHGYSQRAGIGGARCLDEKSIRADDAANADQAEKDDD